MEKLRRMNPPAPPDFMKAIRGRSGISVIAELKRTSPSSPRLNPKLDLLAFAGRYKFAGAAAISVLTEEDHFGGRLEDLRVVAGKIGLPVLRKDFIMEDYQLYESKAHGAAAALLIVKILKPDRLRRLHRLAIRLKLAPLVEIHDERELDAAVSIGAELIGVNNRNLSTLKTDLDVCRRLLPRIPRTCVAVAESGYSTMSELLDLKGMADAVLIGTAFLKNPRKLRELIRARG